VATAVEETLAYYDFPEEHRRRIQFNNPLNAFCARSAENPRRRLVPGWAIGAQSRRGWVAPYRGHRSVDQTLSEHRTGQGPADERRCYAA
jgi:hypothetical protein